MKNSILLTLAAALTISSTDAATVLSNTAAFGFSDLLTYRNATSKGFNFGNSAANAPATTLLGVTFRSNLGANDTANGLTFTTAPLTYAIGGFAWGGAPEQAARDALSKGGLHGGSGNFAMKFATTAGKVYVVEVLALDASAPSTGRSMDIIIDNVTVIDDWHVPQATPYNKLARIEVVADADGVDLRMGRGGIAGTDQNPAISAVAITEVLNAPPAFAVHPCDQSQPPGGTATFSVTAGGAPVPTLQWRKNGTPISGQTGTTLTLTGLTPADVTTYDCVATNSLGSSTSNAAALTLAPIVTASAMTADLKGYWRFDETSGCSAADTSGQHRSGNLINFSAGSNTQWTAGRIGGALRFGGPSTLQHVIVPAVPLPAAPSYTIAAWVMADSRPVWASIAKNWFGFAHFGLDAGGGQLSNYFGLSPSGQIRVAETELFPLSTWQHVVCTVDSSTLKLYRNGVLTATQAYTGTMYSPLPAPMGIGVKLSGPVADTGSPGYWHGLIDDLALWHRTLGAAEISTLYAAGVQGLSLDNPNPLPPASSLVISEFMGDNSGGVLDEDYDSSDWIELYNGTASAVNLDGYYLTDDRLNKTKWRFPAVSLASGSYLLVWASNKDRRVPGQPLHTSFSLSDGEELYLIAPDGTTIVHGYSTPLNWTQGDASTLIDRYPDETNVSYGVQGGATLMSYFKSPTPGGVNGAATSPYGPIITQEAHTPAQPAPGGSVTVTARIRPQQDELIDGDTSPNFTTSATLTYRVMYGAESSVAMRNDGTGGDALAGDEIWTGVIPGTHGATAGQMLRWSISATTDQGNSRRSPQFLLSDSPQYHGTVVADTALTTPLPVLHRFMQTPALADSEAGTVCSIFFNGKFHDNCRIRIRGNTSRGFPKKSHKIDLPPGRRVPLKLVAPGQPEPPQVAELNINTTYTDKSYVRALLAAEMHALTGIASPEIFHIHQRENGAFYSVALCVENVDDIFLGKHGIDEHGAFYKAVGDNGACDFTTAAAFEKKNRHPEGYADLQSVVTNLGLTGTALETWLFDNVDVPAWVNWHSGSVISQNIDASNKNYYIYRDTLGSREWSVLPWDLDLTFGPDALNTDTIVYNRSTPSTPACASHPLIGARPWQLHANKYNRMIEAMASTPRVRTMIARRLRSLNDQFLATNWFQSRMDALEPVLTADVNADHAKWGASSHFAWSGGTAYTLAQSITRIKNEHLINRSAYLMTTHGGAFSLNFSTGAGSFGVPAAHAATPPINFGTVESNPPGGNQDQEYIELVNPNTFDVDLSAWTLEGGVTFTFTGGTVLPAGQSLYVTPDRYAFRQRTVSPRGGERRFVTGPYSGHLNNFGETLTLKNAAGTIVSTFTVPAAPSDPQRYLAISEIHYNPAGPADDTEFLEFVNTSDAVTLDLAGVKITAGLTGTDALGAPVYFTFPAGTTLAPGARVLVVRNLTAFQAAWPAVPAGQIAGTFPADTALDNGGEALKVEDATGSTVVQFTYDDNVPWPSLPDGDGFSLIHMNPAAGDLHHANAANWRASSTPGGNPGTGDALPAPANPNGDDDGDSLSNLLEHVMGDNAPFSAVRQPDGSVLLTWSQSPGGDAGRIIIESSNDMVTWQDITASGTQTESFSSGLIQHSAAHPAPSGTRIYYRARVVPAP